MTKQLRQVGCRSANRTTIDLCKSCHALPPPAAVIQLHSCLLSEKDLHPMNAGRAGHSRSVCRRILRSARGVQNLSRGAFGLSYNSIWKLIESIISIYAIPDVSLFTDPESEPKSRGVLCCNLRATVRFENDAKIRLGPSFDFHYAMNRPWNQT